MCISNTIVFGGEGGGGGGLLLGCAGLSLLPTSLLFASNFLGTHAVLNYLYISIESGSQNTRHYTCKVRSGATTIVERGKQKHSNG